PVTALRASSISPDDTEDMSMIDWPVAFSTASQALSLVRELRMVDKELNAAEFKLKIAELTASVAELKNTLTDAKDELTEKDKEIARLAALQRRVTDDTVPVWIPIQEAPR